MFSHRGEELLYHGASVRAQGFDHRKWGFIYYRASVGARWFVRHGQRLIYGHGRGEHGHGGWEWIWPATTRRECWRIWDEERDNIPLVPCSFLSPAGSVILFPRGDLTSPLCHLDRNLKSEP
jgi:hypothetical protein